MARKSLIDRDVRKNHRYPYGSGTISKRERFSRILEGLKRSAAEVLDAAVVSQDGFLVTHTFGKHIEAEKLAAACVQIVATVARQSSRLGKTRQKEIIVKNEDYLIYIFNLDHGILAVVLNPAANLPRFLEYANEAAEKLHDMLLGSDFEYLMEIARARRRKRY